MTGKTDQILELLFGTRRLEEVPVSDLKDLLEEFPSFNAVHFFLSKRLKLDASEEFSSETQKTALYFTNPFWLQWLLETPEQVIDKIPAPVKLNPEGMESPMDIVGSESSIWSDRNSSSQETSSYFEESIIQDKEPIREVIRDEDHLTETHFSSFGKDPEPDTVVENRNEELAKEFEEVSHSTTKSITESISAETNTINDFSQAIEIESSDLNNDKIEVENGLNFHEPDDFREEPVPEIEHEEIIATPVFETYQEPVEDPPVVELQESIVEVKDPVPEETHSRTPFFWEKEFSAKEPETVHEPVEEEPVSIAQIPELVKPFQDNPAFLLAENELLVPDEGNKIQQSVHIDPALEDIEKEEKEARVFFEHNPSIWEPAHIKEEEPASQPMENPIVLQFGQGSKVVEEKSVSEESAVLTVESAYPDVQEFKAVSTETVAEIAGDELQFTPYHTVDYFASQGIRFIQEENPTDKFGKQLKSFTAWLKIMKRLPKTLLESEMSAMTEATIHDIAEHSIEEKEVITEAMAQVLALQGQNGRAIDLYQKLSLLNPSKSAYFAARIQQIKSDLT